jgi:hypothetical protein
MNGGVWSGEQYPVSPGSGNFIRDKLTLEFIIHRHLATMSFIITNPQLTEERYHWAIEHLMALMRPYADAEFKKEHEKAMEYYHGKVKDEVLETREGGAVENAKTSEDTNSLIREKYRLIFKAVNALIKRRNLGLEIKDYEDIG